MNGMDHLFKQTHGLIRSKTCISIELGLFTEVTRLFYQTHSKTDEYQFAVVNTLL